MGGEAKQRGGDMPLANGGEVLAMRQDVRERNELRDEPEQEQRKGENL